MKPKKPKGRKLIIILSILVILGAGAYVYVNKVFLPVHFKQIVIGKAEEFLNRKVSIEEIHYTPVKGVRISNIIVFQKDSTDRHLARVDEASFRIVLPSLFKKQQVVIPSIRLKNPTVNIKRLPDGTFSFSDLLSRAKPTKSTASPVLVGGVELKNGTIVYTDQRFQNEFKEVLKDINVKVNLSLKPSVRFSLDFSVPQAGAGVQSKGEFHIPSKKLNARVKLNRMPIEKYLPLFYQRKIFSIKKAVLTSDELILTTEGKDVQISGDIQVPDLNLTFGDGHQLQGMLYSEKSVWLIAKKDVKMDGEFELNRTALKLKNGSTYHGDVKVLGMTLTKKGREVQINGDMNVQEADFSFARGRNVKGRISTKDTDLLVKGKELDLKTTFQINNAEIRIAPDNNVTGTVSSANTVLKRRNNKIDLKTDLHFVDSIFHLPRDVQLKGQPDIDLEIQHTLKSKKAQYGGAVRFQGDEVQGIPKIGTITDLRGKIAFSPEKLETERLLFTAYGAEAQLSGLLENFSDPLVSLQYRADNLQLEKMGPLLPAVIAKNNFVVDGQASLNGTLKGPLLSFYESSPDLTVELKNASLKNDQLPLNITNISGKLSVTHDLLKFKSIQGTFQNQEYNLNGQLINFNEPSMALTLSSDGLNVISQAKLSAGNLQLDSFRGYYLGSTFDVQGNVGLKDKQQPILNLSGDLNVDLSNLTKFLPKAKDKIEKLKLKGVLKTDLEFKGPLKDWRQWQVTGSLNSPEVSIRDVRLENISIKLERPEQNIHSVRMDALFYDGTFRFNSDVDLTKDTLPFKLNADIRDTNLAKLKADTPLKKKLMSGNFSASLKLGGPFRQQEQLAGEGFVSVKDGYIWQFKLLKGLWETLLIPEFENLNLTDAYIDFFVKDEKVRVKQLLAKGKNIELKGDGWIDFNQNINVDVYPAFSELAIIQSDSPLRKGPTSIITQTEGYLTIEIRGTLQKPKYSVSTIPTKLLEETTDVLIDGIQNIFEGIFD